MVGTSKLRDLYERFEEELAKRQARAKAARPKWEPPKTKLDEDPGEVLIPVSMSPPSLVKNTHRCLGEGLKRNITDAAVSRQ